MERHVVVGDTFKHKDAIRAAGGQWDAGNGRWTVPAGADLPAGLSARPEREVAAGRAAAERVSAPGAAEVGERVTRGGLAGTLRGKAVGTVEHGGRSHPATLEHVRADLADYGTLYPDTDESKDARTRHHVLVHVRMPDGSTKTSAKEFAGVADARKFFAEQAARLNGGADAPTPATGTGGTQGGGKVSNKWERSERRGELNRKLEQLADKSRVANSTPRSVGALAEIIHVGPVSGSDEADAARRNGRQIRSAFRETTDSGAPFDVVADELVAAGFDRAEVASHLARQAEKLSDDYMTPAGIESARREIEGWLSRNGGAA